MESRLITISESSVVSVPSRVSMRDFEIAELLGVMVPTVRGKIKALLNSRFVDGNSGGIVSGNKVIPEYFGLEIVISVAFSVDSYQANIFRKHVMSRLTQQASQTVFISLNNQSRDNIYN